MCVSFLIGKTKQQSNDLVRSSSRGGELARQRSKDFATVAGAQQIFTGTLRMRHQSQHIATAITNASDIVARAIRIRGVGHISAAVAVTKNDLLVAHQVFKGRVVTDIVAFSM